jgi:hypothetical protein
VNESQVPIALTIRALRAGAAFAIPLFIAAIVLNALGIDVAERAAYLGVLAVIATPALSLAATVVEAWSRDRTIALLAVAVLLVLGVATGLALAIGG